MKFLCIDVGTTCIKYQLFNESGDILAYESQEYALKEIDGETYLDVEVVEKTVKSIISTVGKDLGFDSLSISTLGESFVLLDENDRVLFLPMLYVDRRGEDEAKFLLQTFGAEKFFKKTGTVPNGMYSISKLLWIKNKRPEVFQKAKKLTLLADYLGYILTGERVIDYGLASRTGCFNVEERCFDQELLSALDIPLSLFSTPKRAGSVVGRLKKDLFDDGLNGLGNLDGVDDKALPVLILGSHDQICATLGAGAIKEGQSADGMGTVECVTCLFSKRPDDIRMGLDGYPCAPYAIDGLYCTYILNYSCGSTVNWFKNSILHGFKGDSPSFFQYIESKMPDGPSKILFLPYMSGSATPFQDVDAKAALLNLQLDSSDGEIYRALLEGEAMEMRLNFERVLDYGIKIESSVATGGGANSKKWLEIKSEIEGIPVSTLRSAEGGLCGLAVLQAVATSSAKTYEDAVGIFSRTSYRVEPTGKWEKEYGEKYEKYKKLYKTLKEFN